MSLPHERDPNSAASPPTSAENLSYQSKDSKSKSQSPPGGPYSFFSDSEDFFSKGRKDKGGRPPRPRLSERIFNRKDNKERGSIFDLENDTFVQDLRKELDNERKMFFDGVDPFGHFPRSRGTSPAPNNNPGSGSPRMGRAGAGFPFESTARTRLDDLAGRHPMFSTMRRQPWDVDDPFARAGSPFQRERNNSGSSGGASGSSTASAGEHEHIIPIRIERSDGSSTTSTGGSASASATASSGKNNPISSTPIPMPAPEGMTSAPVAPQPPPKVQQTLGPQRSSTEVRKSPSPAPGERSPRAQSAPPDSMNDGSGDKKFVSSVNIESNGSTPLPGPQATQFGGNCTKEQNPAPGIGARQIPILIDGLLGRPQNRPAAQPMPDVPNQPQPSQQKASRPAERDLTPPSSKKPSIPKDPMEKILEISNDVKEWEVKIDQYTGTSRKDKEWLLLDEMLTRDLIKLDVIETEGREDVRLARKDCIKLIQNCIAKLEAKVPLSRSKSQVSQDDPEATKNEMDLDQSVIVNGDQPNSQFHENMEIDQLSQKSTSKESVRSTDDAMKSKTTPAIPLGNGDTQAGTGTSEPVKISG